nr:MAG TPA: Portal Protein [Bacteriophage sp.]
MGFFDWFKKKQNNSPIGGLSDLILFSGSPSWENIINANNYSSDVAYSIAYTLANKNVVISRFIQFLADAITGLTVVNKDGDEVLDGMGTVILDEVKTIFGDEGEMTEWVFNSLRNFVATGMSINAPSIVSGQGHAIKIIPLDNRKVRLEQNKEGIFELEYKGKKIEFYSKTLKKPSLNRQGYGDCLFSGAIDDALVDKYTKLTAQYKYQNNADPDIVYKIKDGKVYTPEQIQKIERRFKEKYSGIENKGRPLVTDLIDEVVVIDSMESVIKSIDIRLHSNKNIGMML